MGVMVMTTEQGAPSRDTTTTRDQKINRLSAVSLKRVVEPDVAVPGTVGEGQVLPDELLSIADLPEVLGGLTADQKRTLAREEFGSIVETGVRFESVLLAGFSLEILGQADLTDSRVTYLLHEMGEETRHSRLFVRLLEQLRPSADNPLENWFMLRLQRMVLTFILAKPALFCLLVLTGEEVPDLFQKLASEHPDTDPMITHVSTYHRQEEARHLAFARLVFPERWAAAGPLERVMVRYFASRMAVGMFNTIVHPGVYASVGLPTWATWRAVNRSAGRTALRHRALRPLLGSLTEAGAFRRGRVPRGWQMATGVDRRGREVAAATDEAA
jgi:hypothetical protein